VVASEWNSLEIAKLVVAFLTPLLLLGLGVIVNRAARRVEDAQWANRKLIERRLELYDQMAPLLNGLYCFFRLVGDFRKIDPPHAIELKRELDRLFHVNKFLFSETFTRRYQALMELCFQTFAGVATDARLRVDPQVQVAEMGSDRWRADWWDLFSPEEERSGRGRIKNAYVELMQTFADELGVHEDRLSEVRSDEAPRRGEHRFFASMRGLTSKAQRRRDATRRNQGVLRNVSNVPVRIRDVTLEPGQGTLVPIEVLEDPSVKERLEEGVIEASSYPR
jgi:hypothetical protein